MSEIFRTKDELGTVLQVISDGDKELSIYCDVAVFIDFAQATALSHAILAHVQQEQDKRAAENEGKKESGTFIANGHEFKVYYCSEAPGYCYNFYGMEFGMAETFEEAEADAIFFSESQKVATLAKKAKAEWETGR